MRYWDTSAIVPLLVDEAASADVHAALRADPDIAAWWGTEIECVSAIARREREGGLSAESVVQALSRLDGLAAAWQEVQPTRRVRQTAIRILRVHPLRATDSLQLAAALAVAEDHPETLPFVTFDDRLAQAAAREGFAVVRPSSALT